MRSEQQIMCPYCDRRFPLSKALQNEIKEGLRDEIEDEMRGQLSAKDVKIKRLEKLAEQLQKKARQGSNEEQGTGFEQEIAAHLRNAFKLDEFNHVPRGKRGADILQRVKTTGQKCCGTIVWEAKFTDNWVEGWIKTLKENQAKVEGHTVGIIVTKLLPKPVKHFGLHNGVWTTNFYCAIGLATAIRRTFEEVHHLRATSKSRDKIQDLIFDYLTSRDFTNRIIESGEALREMRNDIDKERGAMEQKWSRREKQIQRIARNVAGIYGDISGLGARLQSVPVLELESGDSIEIEGEAL